MQKFAPLLQDTVFHLVARKNSNTSGNEVPLRILNNKIRIIQIQTCSKNLLEATVAFNFFKILRSLQGEGRILAAVSWEKATIHKFIRIVTSS